jgi:hypothetical protein
LWTKALGQLFVDKVALGLLSVDKVALGRFFVDKVALGQIFVDKVALGQLFLRITRFSISVLFHKYSMLAFICMFLLPVGQMDQD